MSDRLVGFVGLGIMGLPMAKKLLDAGYTVVGHNRSRDPVDELVEYGGEGAASAAEAARRSDVVVTCLPDSEVVEAVVRGDDGLMEGFAGGETLIDCSTISPSVTEELAEDLAVMDVDMLDAPISGGEEGAIEGTLSIMVGGEADVLDAHCELLAAMGGTITHCGPGGAGQVAKACNQVVVANTMEAVSEAIVLAGKAGADVEAVVEAISGGAAGCWTLDNRAPSMIRGEFDPGFFAAYQYKDLRIATGAGEEFGAPMPITQVTHDMYKTMEETGMGEDDNSGVMQVLEMMAGEEIRIDGE
jgi:3-hydroxyisobutyrate dehydrogenase-like beta-hydroxyacid dehydrogenase